MAEKTKNDDNIEKKKCTTPVGIASYPHLIKPGLYEGRDAGYGVNILFDANDDLTAIQKAAFHAKVETWGKDKAKWPKLPKLLKAGDPSKPEQEGKLILSCKRKTEKGAPPIKARDGKTDHPDGAKAIYAGCKVRAQLIAYAYEKSSNGPGVGFYIQGIQFVGDGTRLGGGDVTFDQVDTGEDDPDNYSDDGDTDTDGDDLGGIL